MTETAGDAGDQKATPDLNPAALLLGLTLRNGWRVIERAQAGRKRTGGCFSVGYVVESQEGKRAFLKAFDFFSWIADREDPARELEPLLAAYNFERDLLAKCQERRLSRVVRAIDDGTVIVPGLPAPLSTVQYLIFELAEGDVRLQLDVTHRFDLAWALRSLHHVAVALEQLHRTEVVHQDLKPSNVLMFDARRSSKVGDLGRAATRSHEAPLVAGAIAGDTRYCPPENLYGRPSAEWPDRLARDAYHLGSMIVFFFTLTSMTAVIRAYLEPALRSERWAGTFDEVLPYLRAAFEQALSSIREQLPEKYRADLLSMIRQLCDPDPSKRGHPLNRRWGGNPWSLERYITRLNVLATRAECQLAPRPQ